jgi:hypothetical protein
MERWKKKTETKEQQKEKLCPSFASCSNSNFEDALFRLSGSQPNACSKFTEKLAAYALRLDVTTIYKDVLD